MCKNLLKNLLIKNRIKATKSEKFYFSDFSFKYYASENSPNLKVQKRLLFLRLSYYENHHWGNFFQSNFYQ